MAKIKQKKVLVIDDDQILKKFLVSVIRRKGYQTIEAEDGRIGLHMFRREDPDLVLLDLRMPEIDGLDVLKEIAIESPLTPVIIVSGTNDIKDAIESLRRGAWDYITKPVQDYKKVNEAIEKAFDRSRQIQENKSYQEKLEKLVGQRTAELESSNRELIQSESRMRSIVENFHGGIFIVNDQFQFTYVNEELGRLLGDPQVDLVGRDFREFLDEEVQELVVDRYRRRQKGEAVPPKYELILRRIGGEKRIAEISAATVKNSQGKIETIAQIIDITERKKAELALRESEERYRAVVEDQTETIVRYTPDEKITFVNDSYCRFFGIPRQQLIGNHIFDHVYKEDLSAVRQKIASLSKSQPMAVDERRVVLPNGKIGWQQWTDRAIFNKNNKIIEYQAVGIDILDRKIGEEALHNALNEVEKLKNQLQDENIYLREEIQLEHNFEEIIGSSPAIKEVLRQVEMVAPNNVTALIYGETGTGKELIARAIHNLSERRKRPLVKVNCAALPPNLIESELFGHEKGAFTGAVARRLGRFELANESSIFLDEIAELPIDLQAKLLRVLQEGEFERVGGMETRQVDVRIIAATNRNLEKAVESGHFREDLYYRLNVIPIKVPSLRERREDIPQLAMHFAKKYGRKQGKKFDKISKKTITHLQQLPWEGNIRELENVIERAVLFSKEPELKISHPVFLQTNALLQESKNRTLEIVEKEYILAVLEEKNWTIEGKNGAAKVLGLHPNTLRSRMKKLQIRKP